MSSSSPCLSRASIWVPDRSPTRSTAITVRDWRSIKHTRKTSHEQHRANAQSAVVHALLESLHVRVPSCRRRAGWFEQWERKGDHPIRYFLEPCFLTANYALNVLGYEDLYMAGLSGGGWTTTMASAMDPRIRISFPIAGSVPQDMRDPYVKTWPVGNDAEDYEQSAALNPAPPGHPAQPGRPFYTTCNYTCAYLLAGLERGRAQVQILHENDSCCFATHGRHDQMLAYERNVRAELGAADRTTSASHGWFTCTADLHDKHEVSHKDKRIIASVMQHGGASPGWRPAASAWDEVRAAAVPPLAWPLSLLACDTHSSRQTVWAVACLPPRAHTMWAE